MRSMALEIIGVQTQYKKQYKRELETILCLGIMCDSMSLFVNDW